MDNQSTPLPKISGSHAMRQMHALTLTIICSSSSLSGCVDLAKQAHAYPLMVVPQQWSTPYDASRSPQFPLVDWWLYFDDPLLTDLIGEARLSNTTVLMARANLRAAQALRDVAAASLMPVLDAGASVQSSSTSNASRLAQLDANWSPDLFGQSRYGVAAATANVQASAASMADVQLAVAAEIAQDYTTMRGSQSRLEIASANLSTQTETLQIVRWRMQAGLATLLEVEQARADMQQTQAQLPKLQISIEQSRHALAVLTGQAPAALSDRLSAPAPIPQAIDNLALDIPIQTLRQRPDVRQAEYLLRAALARYAQADAARLPSFDLAGSIGINSLGAAAVKGTSFFSSILASISVPIFHGGALRARVREQQAEVEQARAFYGAAVLKALREVEDALVAIHEDRLRLMYVQEAADAGLQAAALARQKFNSGIVDFQVVLATQRTQLTTQDSVAVAMIDISSDHIRLYQALGGGWKQQAVLSDE